MATRRLRATSARKGRLNADGNVISQLDELDVKIVELESIEEFGKISFVFDEYFRVKNDESSKCHIGDVLVRVGGVDVLDLSGGIKSLEAVLASQETWPIAFEFRTGLALPNTTVPKKVTHYMPQIPSAKPSTASIAIDTAAEIDLTLDDDDDCGDVTPKEAEIEIVRQTSDWKKGQIVRTRYGVGSVLDVDEKFVTIMLHWGGVEDVKSRPVAYLNKDEPISDCSNETVFHQGDFILNRAEFARFSPGMYLNDTIIDLFLHRLVYELCSPELSRRCHVMTSHFYSKLEQNKFAEVATWTKNVNIFEKDFVFIPVNESNHWSLAILCFPGRIRPQNPEDGSKLPVSSSFAPNCDSQGTLVSITAAQNSDVSSNPQTSSLSSSVELGSDILDGKHAVDVVMKVDDDSNNPQVNHSSHTESDEIVLKMENKPIEDHNQCELQLKEVNGPTGPKRLRHVDDSLITMLPLESQSSNDSASDESVTMDAATAGTRSIIPKELQTLLKSSENRTLGDVVISEVIESSSRRRNARTSFVDLFEKEKSPKKRKSKRDDDDDEYIEGSNRKSSKKTKTKAKGYSVEEPLRQGDRELEQEQQHTGSTSREATMSNIEEGGKVKRVSNGTMRRLSSTSSNIEEDDIDDSPLISVILKLDSTKSEFHFQP